MSFMFDFDKYKKGGSQYCDDFDGYADDEFDYEYSDELFFDDDYEDDLL